MSDLTSTVTMTVTLDADDARAVHAAIARRQAMRVTGECILPGGESDAAGALLAEICRSWLDDYPFPAAEKG